MIAPPEIGDYHPGVVAFFWQHYGPSATDTRESCHDCDGWKIYRDLHPIRHIYDERL